MGSTKRDSGGFSGGTLANLLIGFCWTWQTNLIFQRNCPIESCNSYLNCWTELENSYGICQLTQSWKPCKSMRKLVEQNALIRDILPIAFGGFMDLLMLHLKSAVCLFFFKEKGYRPLESQRCQWTKQVWEPQRTGEKREGWEKDLAVFKKNFFF